ncbi:hypothetical protein [Halalkalirubrum salinum]|uniref:hypothetical protein n=1 Tax=Halalkalirubrum salinum TaxID=2563889 RepID=UPI0010FB6553|nr:hypothetical protein [Halalkalirubrum salinum]
MSAVAPASGLLARFIGWVLLALSCFVTSYYAWTTAERFESDRLVWRYLAVATGVGGVFGFVAIASLLSPRSTLWAALTGAVGLFFVILLSLSIRELYFESAAADRHDEWISLATARRIETAFMLVILLELAVLVSTGFVWVTDFVQVIGAIAFASYGVSFAYYVRVTTAARGTVMDSVLTYAVAVLLTISVALAIEPTTRFGVYPALSDSVVTVLVVMSASFLIVLIVRFRQTAAAGAAGR